MLRLAIAICALGAFGSAPAIADHCSGGADGGMDATGSECSDPGVNATRAPTEIAAPTDTRAAVATASAQNVSPERVTHQKPRPARHRAHATGAPQRVSTDAADR